jgi:hypothetical protein
VLAETAEQLFYFFRVISLQFQCVIRRMMLAMVLGILILIKLMKLVVGGKSVRDSVLRGALVGVQWCCQVQIPSISSFSSFQIPHKIQRRMDDRRDLEQRLECCSNDAAVSTRASAH